MGWLSVGIDGRVQTKFERHDYSAVPRASDIELDCRFPVAANPSRSTPMTTQPLPRTFTAPGPGTWKQDSAHSPRPVTMWKFESFAEPFVRGFKEGTARYGLLFDHLEPAEVNGFLYYHCLLYTSDAADERSSV